MQEWDTKQYNHNKLERVKRLARENCPTYQKIRSRYPGRFMKVAGMSALAMQATGSKYGNNTHFDNDSVNPVGIYNMCSGCISNIMDDLIGTFLECNQGMQGL